jgi:hypothetical protein
MAKDNTTATQAQAKELTSAQLVVGGDTPLLAPDSSTSGNYYKTVRKMRRHPTVALVRDLSIAPLLTAGWSIESSADAPQGAKENIDATIQPLRIHLLRSSLFGCVDYGWQAYEKVFAMNPKLNFMQVQKMKPLLQDKTSILIDVATGAFAGLMQTQPDVTLTTESCLLVNMDVEGTYWYGEPKMKAVEVAYTQWNLCNDAAVRYDKKLAGAHWIIHYPPGKTKVDGVETDNYTLAQKIASGLQSSGIIIVPRWIEDFVQNANEQAGNESAWKIELLSAYPTSNVAFVDRLKYIDALMARGLGFPERATLEGQFGTKAEAEAHADIAISNMELRHQIMVQQYNWHMVNQLLRINYGPDTENTVWISVAPITDLKLQYLRAVYTAFLGNQQGFAAEADNIDMNSLRDKLGVPTIAGADNGLNNIAAQDPAAQQAQDAQQAAQAQLSFTNTLRRLIVKA